MIEKLTLIMHVLTAAALIGLVLIQQGKGADMGASFGSGSSQTLFGSTGSGGFLARFTAILAAIFFVTSFSLAILAKQRVMAGDADLPAIEMSLPLEPQSTSEVPSLAGTAGTSDVPAAPVTDAEVPSGVPAQ